MPPGIGQPVPGSRWSSTGIPLLPQPAPTVRTVTTTARRGLERGWTADERYPALT